MIAATELLFGGTINTVNIASLAQTLGVDRSTVYRWQKNPDLIRFDDLKTIIKLRGLTNEQVLNLFGRKGGSK